MKTLSAAQRADMMLNAPVNRVIPRLAVPTICSMLVTSICNMADTFFVSQMGTAASGAVGIIFSAMSIIQAVSSMIGMGAGANASQALAALCLSRLDALVRFLGATETIAPYARDYATYIFYAAPFMMCSFVMNNLLRFEGLAFYGMVGIATGSVLNMLLDPLLIFVFEMGTAGAGIATAVSQFVSFCILLFLCNTRPDALSIRLRDCKPSRAVYGRILNNGIPSLGRQGISSVSTILLNTAAGAYGDAAIAAMSIVSRFISFVNSSVIGFGQGFQPVCGFSYGAGRYTRVREAFWYCVKVATVILLALACVSMLFSEQIITVFRRDDPEVIRIGTRALRLQLCTIPLWGFIVMGNMLTQSIGYGVRATLLSTARQGIFLIPALLVLPRAFGLTGIHIAQPVSDVCTLIFTLVIIAGVLRQLKHMPDRALS